MDTEALPLDNAIARALSGVTTATLTTVLLKKGLRNVWMRGSRSLRSGQGRIVGRAFTLRFVPVREDLATPESWSAPISTRAAIEKMPADSLVGIGVFATLHVRPRSDECRTRDAVVPIQTWSPCTATLVPLAA